MSASSFDVLVCKGPVCAGQRDADTVHEVFCSLIAARCVPGRVRLLRKNCFGRCTLGPNVYVRATGNPPQLLADPAGGPPRRGVLYHGVTRARANDIVDQHIIRGRLVPELSTPSIEDL